MYISQFLSYSDFQCILPEICLIISLLFLIIIDFFIQNSTFSIFITLIGCITSNILLISQWYDKSNIIFFGSLNIDSISTTFRLVIVLCCLICVPLSIEYFKRSKIEITEFLIFLLSATIGGMFVCSANDLITVFVAIECLSISSYLLAGYTKKDVRSNEAIMKYLLLGGANSAILAYGFSWLYGLSYGKIQINEIATNIFSNSSSTFGVWIAVICIIVAISFKISLVPFHQWTPDVYEGSPTPVVAFFSVGSKAAGLALAARFCSLLFTNIEPRFYILFQILSLLSMIFGNLAAITQTSIKRMLAYSSISQIGYLIIGIITGTMNGYVSMVTYMITYTFMTLGAFASVIIFSLKTGSEQIRDYTGLLMKDPYLTLCLSICLLSLAGMPPFIGFFVKLYLFWSAWQLGLYFLVYVALITSVISLYYYLRIIKAMISKEPKEMSFYVQNYKVTKNTTNIFNNSIEFSMGACTFVSVVASFFIATIISNTETFFGNNNLFPI